MSLTTATPARTIPAPVVYPDYAAFWAGTAEGRLLLRYCCSCGKPHWYPRPQCPLCMGEQTEWKQSAGNGSIYSFSVCRRARRCCASSAPPMYGMRRSVSSRSMVSPC